MNLVKKLAEYFSKEKVKEIKKTIKDSEEEKEKEVKKSEVILNSVYYPDSNRGVIVLTDNTILQASLDEGQFNFVTSLNNKEGILNYLRGLNEENDESINEEEIEISKTISPILNLLDFTEDFIVNDEKVYLKEVKSIKLSKFIVAEFLRILSELQENLRIKNGVDYVIKKEDLNDEYKSLLMFTYKLLLNPIESSREDCLEYVKRFNIKLTNTGNMIMYRRILSVDTSNKDLIDFVSTQYIKVKSWKKSPKNYEVFDDNGLIIAQGDKRHDYNNHQGNLADLYNSLSQLKENRYTDNHTRTYDIRIGATYKINEEDIDLNKNGSCGGSLHVAEGKVFNYKSFGDTPVVCIVNPMHVYKMDSGCSGKIGVKQMFIAAIVKQDEFDNYIDIDNQNLVNFDELYHNETLEELSNSLKNKSFENLTIKDQSPEITIKEVQNIENVLINKTIKF